MYAQASRNRQLEGQLERYHSQDPHAFGKDGGKSADLQILTVFPASISIFHH
jgi:hypothetical protein